MSVNVVLVVVTGIWVAFEAAVALYLFSSEAVSERRDRGSLATIWASLTIACLTAWTLAQQPIGTIEPAAVLWIGLALIVIGVAVRWVAILTLRRLFTVSVTIRARHELIRHGIYSVVRHPAYAGWIISFVGFGLIFGNWFSFLAVATATLVGFGYRIRVEEHALRGHFGDEYRDYAAQTKRLVPWVF